MTIPFSQLMQQRVILVGGKGGVGKTTVSAAIAVKAAAAFNKNVLLVSTDPAHSLSDVFGRAIGSKAVHLQHHLHALELDPEKEVDLYLERVLSQMRRYAGPDQIHELQRHLRLSRLSPGAQEAALLERMAQLLQHGLDEYDLIIFDTAPTGHTLRLLSLPEVMAAWTDGLLKHNKRSEQLGKVLAHLSPGKDVNNIFKSPHETKHAGLDEKSQELVHTLEARQSLFHHARRVLHDPKLASFIFVLTAERLPVLETERAVQSLKDIGVNVAGLIINRLLPPQLEGGFWQAHLTRQHDYLQQIEQRLGQLPQHHLWLQEQEIQGPEALEQFAAGLSTD
ncbi:ArsA family ATPase [Paenalcaligenes hominis]|uniref:ArsA family ATPase n=1 Tax=Paenalcaligenes hominis TaxID=643674 RepID=UPI003523CE0D